MTQVKIVDGEEIPCSPEDLAQMDTDAAAPPADLGPPPRIYKVPMFRKMTDAEYEAYLQIRAGFPPRLQAIFDAAEYLSPEDEFWPDLVAAANQVYGAERAAELLAPTR
jgi:hypothetical protein